MSGKQRPVPADGKRPLSLARSLIVTLVLLVIALSAIAARGVSQLYESRRGYENELRATFEIEVAAANLLTIGTIEEAILRQGLAADDPRRDLAQKTFARTADSARQQTRGDPQSERLLEARISEQAKARDVSLAPAPSAAELDAAVREARDLTVALSDRQEQRRADAREDVRTEARRAVIIASGAGLLAALASVVLVTAFVARMRRPLEDLVLATKSFSRGNLQQRIKASGPRELRDLGVAFNAMAGELEAAYARIEDERRRLARTIESLGDALLISGEDGNVTSTNPRARELIPELGVGANVYAPGSPLASLDEAGSQESSIEIHGRTLAVTRAPFADGADELVWTLRDISERARLERSKSEFVATASHELRSPLTSIRGFAELLARTETLDDQQREFVDVIRQSTNRLANLVNDLLDVARIEAGRIEVHPLPVDLVPVAREIATMMTPQIASKQQSIDVKVDATVPVASADPDRFRQVLTNLVTNAHLYTDEGGKIEIRIGAADGAVAISVTDNGHGMTADEVEHIFDRFYRADTNKGRGTGLGLSIVKALVELQDGSIHVDSIPGKGSRFTVRFPIASSSGDDSARVISGKSVLVVDDEVDVAKLIATHLRALGAEVHTAFSGDHALRRVRQERFDAMILDIRMPDMSGFEVLATMRADARLQQMPVVVVSVISDDARLQGEYVVPKPIQTDLLEERLSDALLSSRQRAAPDGVR